MGGSLKTLRLVLIGPIASGKGTISGYIIDEFPNFVQISPGDILRREIKENSPLGQKVKKYVGEGKLVPDEYVIQSILREIGKASKKNWILDGFPRTIAQANMLHEIKNRKQCSNCEKGLNKNPISAVIYLNIPDKIVIQRSQNRYVHLPSGRVYSRGFREPRVLWKDDVTGEDLVKRADDNPAVVKDRLETYRKMTEPLIGFYRYHGIKVLDVNTEFTEDAWHTIRQFIKTKI